MDQMAGTDMSSFHCNYKEVTVANEEPSASNGSLPYPCTKTKKHAYNLSGRTKHLEEGCISIDKRVKGLETRDDVISRRITN